MRNFRIDKISFHTFVESLTTLIELKDSYTAGHSDRVSKLSEKIAKAMDFDKDYCEYLHIAGHLHDIGKLGIPEGILMKSGKLTEAEFNVMKQHPMIGYDVLKQNPELCKMATIIKGHHERFDGKGYPEGLKADEIDIGSCIIALADSFDAMTTTRTYREGLMLEEAIEEIQNEKGRQFHPEVADIFVKIYEQERNFLEAIIKKDTQRKKNNYISFKSENK